MAEGLHLNGKGLHLLMELDQLDREISSVERLGFRGLERHKVLTARRERTLRRAEAHCRQAGISWNKFRGVLRKGKSGPEARAD